MGVSHLLANLLRPSVEITEDEYITTRFEELTERLSCLERVDVTNPSLDNRLTAVYQGLRGTGQRPRPHRLRRTTACSKGK